MKVRFTFVAVALTALSISSAHAATPPSCESGQITCAQFCMKYRGNSQTCLVANAKSCKAQFGSEGNNGYDHCVRDTPPGI